MTRLPLMWEGGVANITVRITDTSEPVILKNYADIDEANKAIAEFVELMKTHIIKLNVEYIDDDAECFFTTILNNNDGNGQPVELTGTSDSYIIALGVFTMAIAYNGGWFLAVFASGLD